MHELSLCRAIIDIVHRHAAGRTVRAVNVQAGAFRQIVPDTLTYCWSLVTDGSDLAGAELRVEYLRAEIRCTRCGHVQVLDAPALVCPVCSSRQVDLIAGDEFLVSSLDVAEG